MAARARRRGEKAVRDEKGEAMVMSGVCRWRGGRGEVELGWRRQEGSAKGGGVARDEGRTSSSKEGVRADLVDR